MINERIKNGDWVEAKSIKYERFALIKDVFAFIKRRLKEIISELKGSDEK